MSNYEEMKKRVQKSSRVEEWYDQVHCNRYDGWGGGDESRGDDEERLDTVKNHHAGLLFGSKDR